MGKQTLLGVFVVLMLGAVAWRANQGDLLTIAVLGVGIVGFIAILNFIYATRHPMEAMLEGSEIIAYQHQALAAKFITAPPKETLVIPKPGSAPPQFDAPKEPERA